MIVRIWHGWTTEKNADEYEKLLKGTIFPSIEGKKINGFRKINLLKRAVDEEVEFITLMYFDDLQAVIDFAGKEYEKAFVPIEAQNILSRYDHYSEHYELLV